MHENYKHYVSSRILANSKAGDNGCINYADTKHKYGLISITIDGKRKSVPAHRAMYMAMNDCFDMPRNNAVRHKCDNPRCVNIEHLIIGTSKDNAQDCIERGRRARKHKPHTRQRIVTDDTVTALRAEPQGIKQWYIADKYGVSVGYVSKLRSGKAKGLVSI